MNYSKQELEAVEKYASIYLPISDMAVMLDVPDDILRDDIKDRHSDVGKAYLRGKIASKLKLHQQEMTLAMIGSPQALQNAKENLLDMEEDE